MAKNKRPYGLGERNPQTLPGVFWDSESPDQNEAQSRAWRTLRKQVQNGSAVGWRYV